MILNILWAAGRPLSVREIFDAMPPGKRVGYNSYLKRVQIMEGRGYVTRAQGRPARYEPMPEEQTKASLVQDLVQRVFGGSAQSLVDHLVSSKKVTSAERAAMKRTMGKQKGKR